MTIGIEGWPEQLAHDYLAKLEAKATAAPNRYTHQWKPGDAVLWDNRRVIHAGTPYDMDAYTRRMHRTTWREDSPIV